MRLSIPMLLSYVPRRVPEHEPDDLEHRLLVLLLSRISNESTCRRKLRNGVQLFQQLQKVQVSVSQSDSHGLE
jgi:hypothetical protein